MAKPRLNIDAEMSRLAARRDELLPEFSPSISPVRLQQLQAALAKVYPVETALRRIALERDASLGLGEGMPTPVTFVLANRLRLLACSNGEAPRHQSVVVGRRLANPIMAAAAAIALFVGFWFEWQQLTNRHGVSTLVPRPSEETNAVGPVAGPLVKSVRGTSFAGATSDDYLNLQVSAVQLLALQSSALGIERSIASSTEDLDQVLPLNLPVRQISLDRESMVRPQ